MIKTKNDFRSHIEQDLQQDLVSLGGKKMDICPCKSKASFHL